MPCPCCTPRRALPALAAALLARPASAQALLEPSLRLAAPPAGSHALLLTLDACPGGFDLRLAQALVALNIPATICLTATWLGQNPEGLAFLLAHPGLFGFANHGARHLAAAPGHGSIFGVPAVADLAALDQEVAEGAARIAAATGTQPRWYRGATGLYSAAALAHLRGQGVAVAGYALSADQGASMPAAAVASRLAGAANGAVVVGHINQPHRPSGAGLAQGLAALHAAGTVFLRLDRLPTEAFV